MNRALGIVSAALIPLEARIHAWGRTSGGASQALDPGSYGVSSITDFSTGVLDVTWSDPLSAGATYSVIPRTQTADTTPHHIVISSSTPSTSTTVRFISASTSVAADPSVGYHWICIGM